jgi:hypothetical protein
VGQGSFIERSWRKSGDNMKASENIINILSSNFDFNVIEDDIVGKVIQMEPHEAYFYSSLVGSSYLDNPQLPFSPKGRQNVFNQALNYSLITSFYYIDEKSVVYPWNTPREHKEKYPFISEGKKFIVPIEIKKSENIEYRKILFNKLNKIGKRPEDYILTEIRLDVDGYGLESFYEYVVCNYFRKIGFITENQIPLFYKKGTPDVGLFKIPSISKKLQENKLNPNNFLIELSSISTFNLKFGNKITVLDDSAEIIVGEAKTSCSEAEKQLNKYVSTGLYNLAYEIIPKKNKATKYSLITFNKSGILNRINTNNTIKVDSVLQKKYVEWMENYIKFYIIGNLSKDEFNEILRSSIGTPKVNAKDFIKFVISSSLEDIINIIRI